MAKKVIGYAWLGGLVALMSCSADERSSPSIMSPAASSGADGGDSPAPPATLPIPEDAGADAEADARADAAPPSTLCRDARADAWTLPLTKTSNGGSFQISLKSAVPAPARVGQNAWTLTVSDPSGNAVTGAEGTLTAVTTWMPDHGHGSAAPTLLESSPGSWVVDPVQLFMGGYWEVTATVTSASKTEKVTFGYCVRTVP